MAGSRSPAHRLARWGEGLACSLLSLSTQSRCAGCAPCPPGGILKHNVHHTEFII